jgi:excisionase family DNA binding protein
MSAPIHQAVTPEPLWTAEDVARHLRCSRSAVYAWAERCEIPCRRLGGLLRFRPSEIEAWVDRNARATVHPLHVGPAEKNGGSRG